MESPFNLLKTRLDFRRLPGPVLILPEERRLDA